MNASCKHKWATIANYYGSTKRLNFGLLQDDLLINYRTELDSCDNTVTRKKKKKNRKRKKDEEATISITVTLFNK